MKNFICNQLNNILDNNSIDSGGLIEAINNYGNIEGYYCLYNIDDSKSFTGYRGFHEPALGKIAFDFDSANITDAQKECLQVIEALNPTQYEIFFSGNKGFHLMVNAKALGIEPSENCARDSGAFAEKLKATLNLKTLDLSIYKPAQKFRIPNSLHPKTNRYKIKISLDELKLPTETIINMSLTRRAYCVDETPWDNVSVAREITPPTPAFGLDNLIDESTSNEFITYKNKPCIKRMETDTHDVGQRHSIAMALIGEYKSQGLMIDEVKAKIATFALNNGVFDRLEKDFYRIIDDAFSGKEYNYSCYSIIKKTFCSGACPLYVKLHKDKRAIVNDIPPEVAKQLAAKDSNPFTDDIKNGFHIEKMINKQLVLVPNIEKLTKYFDFITPYVSLRESNITSVWNGTHYEDVSDIEIRMFAHKFFKPAPKIGPVKEFQARIQHTKPVSVKWFKDSTKNKINFLNGVFDTDTGVFEPGHSMARGFKYCLPYEYNPEAKAPMFSEMLSKVTSQDKERADVILEFIGYALSGSPCYSDKVMVMFGDGSNGKTRFLNVIRGIMGNAAVGLKAKDFDKDAKIRKMENALLAITEEMPAFTQKEFWENIKDLASGGELTVDVKYKDAVSFPNKCKIVFTCNKLPMGTDPTHGFFRRLLLVPFDHIFSQSDPDFVHDIDKKIIAAELPGVFNLIWEAFKRLKGNNFKFGESKAVTEQIEAYKVEVDSVARWFQDCNIHLKEKFDPYNEEEFVSTLDMFKNYKEWAEERNVNFVGFTEFGRRTSQILGTDEDRCKRKQIKGVKSRGYLGLSMRVADF